MTAQEAADILRWNIEDGDISGTAAEYMLRLCNLAAKLPPGEAERVLEAAAVRKPGWRYLSCRGYADCSPEQRLAGCAECERVK